MLSDDMAYFTTGRDDHGLTPIKITTQFDATVRHVKADKTCEYLLYYTAKVTCRRGVA